MFFMIKPGCQLTIRLTNWLILLASLLLIGCTSILDPTPVTLATASPTSSPTASPSPTSTPIPTATLPQPTIIAITPAPTPTVQPPTATPVTFQNDRIPQSSQGDTVFIKSTDSTTTPSNSIIQCVVVSAPLNVREGPGVNYRSLTSLAAGETIPARKCSPGADWLLIETPDQALGWVNTAFLACDHDPKSLPVAGGLTPPTLPPPPPNPPAATPVPTVTPTQNQADSQNAAPPSSAPSTDHWQAEYYDNASLLGEPVLVRQDPDLDFDWILAAPAPELPADNFSARWTRLFDFNEDGDYRFFAAVDDGVRVYVDGWLVVNDWQANGRATYFGDIADVKQGTHTVVVEYFESGGHANIKVWAEKITLGANGWRGAYYNNPDWRDPAVLVRQDSTIDFDWDDDPPAEGINRDDFSIRWEQTLFFDPGDYRFFAEVAQEDQVKLYLDGWLLFDEYKDSAGRVESVFNNVGPGNHTITVEYRDDDDEAKIRVWWQKE